MAIGSKDKRHFFKTGMKGCPGTYEISDAELYELQQTLTSMLRDFIRVFEENNIAYTLSGGSVLGTIRHKGFIPWDDDIDLNMSRKEFNKLKKIFDRELGDKYVLCAPEFGRNHGMTHVQIKKKDTVYKAFNEVNKPDVGIFMDIFVLENTYNNIILRTIHGYLCLLWGYILTCRKTYDDFPYLQQHLLPGSDLEKAYSKKANVGRLFSFMSVDKVAKKAYKCYSFCADNRSKYVSIPSGRKHYFGEMYLREDMCKSIEGEFEGMTVKIPKGYPKYMLALYGKNYMVIPPEEDREIHSAIELKF
ncbi:MAG: LicD family protein [Butyrivibrio sp.]|nr:LicD family protein [Butyrivibrio sp.]